MKELRINDWKIVENVGSGFYVCNGRNSIYFRAEYKGGLYFKILSYYSIQQKRCYTAERYFYKIIPIVRELAFELLKRGMLWDYNNQVPALETYKKDMFAYYSKCKEKGLSVEPWLESLYN